MAEDYAKARRLARKEKTVLSSLEDSVPNFRKLKQEPLGVFEVPMYLVRGTATRGRSSSFSGGFLPLLSPDSEFAGKWNRLLQYQESEGIQDPVLVYEYLGYFYVVEGNKRVSVLKYLEQPELTADVVRLLPEGLTPSKKDWYEEYRAFVKCTGLVEPLFSNVGNYPLIARKMGQNLKDPWPEDEVRNLESAVFRFSEQFAELVPRSVRREFGDVFLHYAYLYAPKSLLSDSARKVRFRLRKILRRYKER